METQPNPGPAIKLTGQLATEARLTLEALQRYGELYAVPNDACNLLDLGILGVLPGQQVAAGAIAYIRKHLRLALLSTVRRHRVQAAMNLRQALEMTPILGFVMAKPNEVWTMLDRDRAADDLATMESNDKTIKLTAYAWLAEAHPELSSWVKDAKFLINQTSAHANLISASFVLELPNEAGITTSFFDKPDEALETMGLSEVARASFLALTLLVIMNDTTKTFLLRDGFAEAASNLSLRAVNESDRVGARLEALAR